MNVLLTLHPGEVAFGTRGDVFETLLGSCVAIVLTDRRRSIGAACHVVHAASDGRAALRAIRDSLRRRGMTTTACEAWVYGGANMFPQLYGTPHVGDGNARWALEALADDGVQLLDADLGGRGYRRLRWTVGPEAPRVTTVTAPEHA